MTKQITRVWTFASDSNPNIQYQTLQYADGRKSCDCPGWCRRVAADGSRSCKHYVLGHIMFVMGPPQLCEVCCRQRWCKGGFNPH